MNKIIALNEIIHGDCLEEMAKLPTNSVDVCFTSPPYNVKRNSSIDGKRDMRNPNKYLEEEYRDDWYEWQVNVIDEMLRVSKRLVIYNVQTQKTNKQDVFKIIGHYANRLHDIVIWYKPNGQPTSTPNAVSNTYEMFLMIKPKANGKVKINEVFARNVIEENVNTNNPYSDVHGAVMNIKIAKKMINRYTFEGETVLDPFMGLGTTALACDELGRNYVGVEKFEKYVDIANKRIEAQRNQMTIFDVL